MGLRQSGQLLAGNFCFGIGVLWKFYSDFSTGLLYRTSLSTCGVSNGGHEDLWRTFSLSLAANEKLSQEVLGPGADQIDQSRRFPRENIAALGKAGVLGLLVPAEFGGAGASLGEMSRVLVTQSQACASTAMVTLMHYCATAVIAAKGSDKLKQELLPSFARGGHLSTLAFSEAGSGGHFYAPVSEVRQKRLSASKSFVTSAGEADSYVVSARKAGAAGPTESNLYLISKGAGGLAVQGRFEGLGLAGNDSAPMTLTDVSVDDETRLGPEGSGFQSMLEVVLPHFQIGVASVSVGIATAAFQTIVAHVSGPENMNTPAALRSHRFRAFSSWWPRWRSN